METGARATAGQHGRTFCAECIQAGDCLVRVLNGGESTGRCHVLHRGETVFRAGEPLREIHMLRSGAVKTRVCSAGGQERVLGLHASGDILGVEAIATGVHGCDAVALDTVSVCTLPASRLFPSAAQASWAQGELLRRASAALADQQRQVLLLGHASAEQRVAGFLLQRSRRQQRLGLSPRCLHLPMSRADIASYLALAVETVSRVLTRLQELGVVAVNRNEVHIVDAPRLQAVANEPGRRQFQP
ncbi:MAG: helix-turn-helix domain-containing protein, partial [Gammaproteobacteria bacterium]|nr:helix-turn-helix domain-containing protein [Gammaproteobacteria bacterium]